MRYICAKKIWNRMKEKTKKRIFKEMREWGLLISFFGILYFSGLHTEVIGKLQSVFLHSGLFRAKILEQPVMLTKNAHFTGINGKNLSLEELRGKVVLLNIWATWCPPSVAEMPDLQRLYSTFQHDKLGYIFLSVDENSEIVNTFMKKKRIYSSCVFSYLLPARRIK